MSSPQMSSNLIKVFVYGTLKRNQPNHFWLTDSINNGYSKFLGNGLTVKKFPLVIGTRYNIPFILNKCGIGNQINGEVYEIDDSMFSKLDILEDYPRYYDRELQDIIINDKILSCWLYIIKKFPDSMLNKTFLTSYQSTRELPYCERSERDPNIQAINDLNYD